MIEVGSREWIRATLALSLGSFLVFLNLYQTHPLLPLLAEVFSVSSLSAGWTLAGCTAGLATSQLVGAHHQADQHRPAPDHAVQSGRCHPALPAYQPGQSI